MLEVLNIVFGGNSGVGLTGAWLTDMYAASSLQGLPEQGTVLGNCPAAAARRSTSRAPALYTLATRRTTANCTSTSCSPYWWPNATFVTAGHLNDFDDDDSDYSVAGFTRVRDGGLTFRCWRWP